MFGLFGMPQTPNQNEELYKMLGVNPGRAQTRGMLTAASALMNAGAGGPTPAHANLGRALGQAGLMGMSAYDTEMQNAMARNLSGLKVKSMLASQAKTTREAKLITDFRAANPGAANWPDAVVLKYLEQKVTAKPEYLGTPETGIVRVPIHDPLASNQQTAGRTGPSTGVAQGTRINPASANPSFTTIMTPRGKPTDEWRWEVGSDGRRKRMPTARGVAGFEKAARLDVKPFVESLNKVKVKFEKLIGSLNQKSGSGDIAAINAFVRMVDDGVVRGEDITIMREAASLKEILGSWIAKKQEGELLHPTVREKMRKAAKALTAAETKNARSNLNEIKIRFNKKKYGEWSQVIPKAQETRFKNLFGEAPTFNFSKTNVDELQKMWALSKRNPTRYSAGYKKALIEEINRRYAIHERGG